MCGISGIVAQDAKGYKSQVVSMNNSLKHRGPDGEGIYIDKNFIFGHRRLAIVDIKGGDQPMTSTDGSCALIFNGEIYGYKKLKTEVGTKYHFKTNSDTELILALYSLHKDSFVDQLPGQFAFGLYDKRTKKLICARDRFGEKPLYYAYGSEGQFIFASEIKAILASGVITPVLDKASVAHFIQYLYVHPTKTIYKNIHVLPPGHILTYINKRLTIKKYWEFSPYIKTITINDAVDRFEYLLTQSVAKQLVADVPIGIFLSGGIDSSTIALLAKRAKNNIKTFSYGFTSSPSELGFANRVAKALGTDHQVLYEEKRSLYADLLKMQEIFDEPFADSSNIPTYRITKLASNYCKVALGGDGGDEITGGYGWYKNMLGYKQFDSHSQLSNLLLSAANWMTALFGQNGLQSFIYRLGLYTSSAEFSKVHARQNSYFTEYEMASLGLQANEFEYDGVVKSDWVTSAQRIDIQNYLPGDILVKVDRASMANSLEVRAPFLDKDLADFMLALPSSLKVSYSQTKIILRKFMENDLPKSVILRKKQGFGIGADVSKWLADKDVSDQVAEICSTNNKKIYKLFDPGIVRKYLTRSDYKSWIFLNLALWMEKYDYSIA